MVPQLSVLIFIIVMSLLGYAIQSFPTYDYNICGNVNFTHGSIYEVNLLEVLLALSSNADANKNGFFNFSFSTDSTPVYGCRGDVTAGTCVDCVSNAVWDVQNRCPRSKEACIWYDECSLRYSDANISRSDQEDPQVTLYNVMNISDPNQLTQFIETTLVGEMAPHAASETSGKKFVTKEVELSSDVTLYSLVQCSPHLPVAHCIRCLKNGASDLPPGANGARVLLPCCTISLLFRLQFQFLLRNCHLKSGPSYHHREVLLLQGRSARK